MKKKKHYGLFSNSAPGGAEFVIGAGGAATSIRNAHNFRNTYRRKSRKKAINS